MSFGLTPTGFVPMTLDDIKTELESAYRATFGDSIPLIPQSVFGQIIGISADREAALWQLLQVLVQGIDPDAAGDWLLDIVCALTGTIRKPARTSAIVFTCAGDVGTVLNVGRVASVQLTGVRFATTLAATIAAVPAWSAGTFLPGNRVTNGGKVYQCTTGGNSVSGPTGTGSNIADGGAARWLYIGDGAGVVDVAAEAQTTGPLVAVAGTLTVIETPVAGWNSVVNILDADVGSDREGDPDLRLRREDELVSEDGPAVEAVRTTISRIKTVLAVNVFENKTDLTDADGMPPHSIEALVKGATDDEIRAAVFQSVAGGIQSHGNVIGTVTDSQGIVHTIKFSRPTEVPIYVIVSIEVAADDYPSDGDAQVKQAIADFGDRYKTAQNVASFPLGAQALKVPGVMNITATYIGKTPGPASGATIAIVLRELATFDTSRITVNTSAWSP